MLKRILVAQLIFLLGARPVTASPPRPTEDERSFVKFVGEVRSVRIVNEQDFSWSQRSAGKMPVDQTRVYPKLQIGISECKDLGKGFARNQGFCNNPNFSYFSFCDSQTDYKAETDHRVQVRVGARSLTATGMLASLKDDRVELKSNVRGKIAP